jgi:hypothetical protein
VESVIEDFTSYKNRNSGIWARGEMHVFKNLKLADNAIGYTHASGNFGRSAFTSRVVDSLFVGETENIGNPRTPAEMAYGRSLPEPELADFPIRGYEFYDYRHELDNDTFVNFQDNATRKTGAISYLLYTSFGMSSNNTVQRAKFINAKPVYFPPMEHKWSNDDYGNGSYKTAVFHDKDGSVGGVPDSYILINDESNDGIAVDEACEIKPTWNAAVCKGDVGRLNVGGARSGGPADVVARRRPAGAGPGGVQAVRVAGGPGAGGGPGGPGAAGGPGGGPWRNGCRVEARPAQPPVVLSRNGKEYNVTGKPTYELGTEIKVTTERPSVSLSLTELDSGSWVIFELPGFTTAASGTQQEQPGCAAQVQRHLVLQGQGSLWVKVVSTGEGAHGSGPGAGGSQPPGQPVS